MYEPLKSYRARADEYVPFIERSGPPVLELCCGSGAPMLELLERGYQVEGLDASEEMLTRCRAKAAELGLEVTVYHQEMQQMELPRRYRSIFLAGESFTLLTTDANALETLKRIESHLEPGGSAMIPLGVPDAKTQRAEVGQCKNTHTDGGTLLRVRIVEAETDEGRRRSRLRLRYERIHSDGRVEVLERDWLRSWWTQGMFQDMMVEAGFKRISILDKNGVPAPPDSTHFVFLAQKD